MTLPSLFDFDFSQPTPVLPLGPGDIVRQRGGLHGKFEVAFPYWQIVALHPESRLDSPLWMCRAVPVSEYPGQVANLRPNQMEATGLRWRVPSHAEIERWLKDNWEINSYLAALDFSPDGTIFICHGSTTWNRGNFQIVRPGRTAHWGEYVKFPPLPEEAELLELMRDLPWQCGCTLRRGSA